MDDQDRTTVRRFIFGAVVIILIVVLLWFIFFRNKDKKPNTQNAGSTSQGQPTSPDKGTTNPGSGTTAAPQATQQKTGQLTNVGPGETTTVFVAAAIVGAVGHHLYRKRLQAVSLASGRR